MKPTEKISALGITSFGSGVVSVPADIAIITLSVEVVEPTAKKAFQVTKKTSLTVRKFLDRVKNLEVSTSHITLTQNWHSKRNEGYRAQITYRIKLHNLDLMEKVITNAIDAGANRIQSVNFQNSELRKHRKEARRLAIVGAREKALNYCQAAGVELGEVIHIEDLNPDSLERRGYAAGGAVAGGGAESAMNPGDLQVSGAVKVIYSLKK